MPKKRYAYIDNMKFAACILVALGHFFTSISERFGIDKLFIYNYLFYTVYTFHVQIFFVCSGFLYQKADHVTSLSSYGKNISRKLLDLGVPYVVFTVATLVLKRLVPNDVTIKPTPVLDTIFVHPTAPYWFLYSLFLMFLLIPCMKSKKSAGILFIFTLALKIAYILLETNGISLNIQNSFLIFLVLRVFNFAESAVWFSGGMLLSFFDEEKLKKIGKILSLPFLAAALAVSLAVFSKYSGYTYTTKFVTGIIFVLFTVLSSIAFCPEGLSKISFKLSDLFMPVFVLHTICAAGIRVLLYRLGITGFIPHFIGGMIGSFLAPAVIYMICEKLTPLMFFFYPTRTIKILKGKKNGKNKVSL